MLAENVAQILIDMALGLNHVHESGFMHLDFKPENVLVSRNGNVRLIDFDLAQPIPEKPVKLSKNPGTPGYMAPEQLKREPIDSRADIFAYGVSAYELVTNQKPFPGETPAEILAAQVDPVKPIPPREYNPEIPAALEQVILKCLAHDPDSATRSAACSCATCKPRFTFWGDKKGTPENRLPGGLNRLA